MASTTPLVHDDILIDASGSAERRIDVGSTAWWDWLTAPQTTTFRFQHGDSSFTARRERRRGGWYWYAYRRQAGQLLKSYLGRSEDLTRDHLAAVAGALDRRSEAPPLEPSRGFLPLQPGRSAGSTRSRALRRRSACRMDG